MTYKRSNNIVGWLVFTIALSLYLYTMEPTVSLWDCGEFIAAASKLEVGHPPGAPFYLMLARIFSLFAIDKSHIAVCINSLSAIASAFTILFLFWTITHLVRKTITKSSKTHNQKTNIIILVSGAIGAISFCVSDSFWFSATEAEVYALSSLFTALVFWCILKWEDEEGINRNRWIVLIAFLMGISIGVHLLNLLVIPAIVFIYFNDLHYRKWKKLLLSLVVSFILLFALLYLLIPGTIKTAAIFETWAVNYFHLSVYSGLFFFVVISFLIISQVIRLSYLKKNIVLNTVILCITAILIGYSSYAMIIIRAQANPPLNTGNPSNVYSLLSYLNRDQYGAPPLLYGPYYNAPLVKSNTNTSSYNFINGNYVRTPERSTYTYDTRFMTLFPRIYSRNSNHIAVYKDWASIKGVPVQLNRENKSTEIILKPTFLDNLEFFVTYQVGYMYLRYLMWNFAGKQNDMQGNGGIMKGNWISGFDFIDKLFIGSQSSLPDYMKENPGRNRYFFLPFLLGLAGMIFNFSTSKRYFTSIFLLFIFTGLAIVIYTNQTPLQPRERDYVYVGSFYVFCIWIGFGVLCLINFLQRLKTKGILVGGVAASSVPLIMFFQNFDDHNRHGRFIVRDIAFNYLNSCDPNSILFTVGDNDTYPLWYLQEVEGIRTDVRVVNLMLLNASWYIDQQRVKFNLSNPLPVTMDKETYNSGNMNWIYVNKRSESYITTQQAMQVIHQNLGNIPSDKLILHVNSNGENDSVIFKLPQSYLGKSEMVVLDIINNFNWERPLYFNSPGYKGALGLDQYFQLDGFTYKLVTSRTPKGEFGYGGIETEKLYNVLMHKVEWHINKDIVDDHIRRMLNIMRVRQNYARLALALTHENHNSKAEKVLDRLMENMPTKKVPIDHDCLLVAEAYYKCGSRKKADSLLTEYNKQLDQELNFYDGLSPLLKSWTASEKSQTLYYIEKTNELRGKYVNKIN